MNGYGDFGFYVDVLRISGHYVFFVCGGPKAELHRSVSDRSVLKNGYSFRPDFGRALHRSRPETVSDTPFAWWSRVRVPAVAFAFDC